jgi:hypothetical protein
MKQCFDYSRCQLCESKMFCTDYKANAQYLNPFTPTNEIFIRNPELRSNLQML